MSIVPKLVAFVVSMRIFEMFIKLNVEWVQNTNLGFGSPNYTLATSWLWFHEDVQRMLVYPPSSQRLGIL